MGSIRLNKDATKDYTMISNIFIDKYMPHANGDYIKIYLFLHRCLNGTMAEELSIDLIADSLDCTTKDIFRALHHWEKVKLIILQKNAEGEIEAITLVPPEQLEYQQQEETTAKTVASSSATASTTISETSSSNLPTVDSTSSLPATASIEIPDRNAYRMENMGDLTSDKNFTYMKKYIEVLSKRMFTPEDANLLLYLQKGLLFSKKLIEYLYEYCIQKNKDNNSYIERVALNWYKAGIHTVEEAKQYSLRYSSTHNIVRKAFGIDRQLGEKEASFVRRWTEEFHMSDELLKEGCDRTLLKSTKPDFPYANSIFERWYKKNITTMEQVREDDEAYHKNANYKNKENDKNYSSQKSQKQIPYNEYTQRNYSKSEMKSIEQRLLHGSS